MQSDRELAKQECAQAGCEEEAAAAWRSEVMCVAHFLEATKEYVERCCSWETYRGQGAGRVDAGLLAGCIFQTAALLAAPAPLERAQQTELLRLLSFCHGLLRMLANDTAKRRAQGGQREETEAALAAESAAPETAAARA